MQGTSRPAEGTEPVSVMAVVITVCTMGVLGGRVMASETPRSEPPDPVDVSGRVAARSQSCSCADLKVRRVSWIMQGDPRHRRGPGSGRRRREADDMRR